MSFQAARVAGVEAVLPPFMCVETVAAAASVGIETALPVPPRVIVKTAATLVSAERATAPADMTLAAAAASASRIRSTASGMLAAAAFVTASFMLVGKG